MSINSNQQGRETFILSGEDWVLTGWQCDPVQQPDSAHDEAIPAQVPGDVHADLQRAGLLPDLYWGLNSKQASWVPRRWWQYRKDFVLDKHWAGRLVYLVFDGVDYACRVRLNGHAVGRHEGQFTTFRFDVSRFLLPGQNNVLDVIIEPPPQEILDVLYRQAGYGQPHQDAQDLITTSLPYWKSRTVTGWDWGTPLWSAGIWRNVRLIGTEAVHAAQPLVTPTVEPPYTKARLNITQTIQSSTDQHVRLQASIRQEGSETILADSEQQVLLHAGEASHTWIMQLDKPDLWWPNGYGDQPMYQLEVQLSDVHSGNSLDCVSTTFGIRHLEILPNPVSDETRYYIDYFATDDWHYKGPVTKEIPANEQAGPPMTVRINGVSIFLRGGNWLPADLQYGTVNRERYRMLLREAINANYNAFRIWGGGLIEKQDFYELCDRYGLLVLQELPHAGRRPLETDEALENERQEITNVLPQLMNHPSVIRYGFGNELYLDDKQSRQASQFLQLCQEIDPSRPAYLCSPLTCLQRHGPHWFYFDEGYTIYNTGYPMDAGPDRPLEWDEYGAAGMPCEETLRRFMPDDHIWPVDEADDYWIWHKAFEAYRQDRWLSRPNYTKLFGQPDDLKTEIRISQWAQAEGLRYANQANRRNPLLCGCLAWTFNEPWPNAAHGCIVDYFGNPKMASYYVRKSYAPIDISAAYPGITCRPGHQPDITLWVCNDSPRTFGHAQVKIEYRDLTGHCHHEQHFDIDLPDWSSTSVGCCDFIVPETLDKHVLLVHVSLFVNESGPEYSQTYVFGVTDEPEPFSSSPPLQEMLHAPQSQLQAACRRIASDDSSCIRDRIAITNSSTIPALYVDIHVQATETSRTRPNFSDNYFCLMPGQTMTVDVTINDSDAENIASYSIEAWNSERTICVSAH